MYGVHRTFTEMAAASCGTSHASAVSTPLWWIFKKTCYKKLVTHVESHARASVNVFEPVKVKTKIMGGGGGVLTSTGCS